MSDLGAVLDAIRRLPAARQEEGRILVPTQCLYPSNGAVVVVVEGGPSRFGVHDNAGALDELSAAGGIVTTPLVVMRPAVRRQGLELTKKGIILSPTVPAADLPAAIVLVANASKEAAHRLIDNMRPRPMRNFRAELEVLLKEQFGTVPLRRELPILGKSNKPHKFDYVVQLGGQRQLVLDAVSPDANSINAAVVAHLDLREAGMPHLVQRIVYDDHQRWPAADLNLLSVGAPAVPFSQAPEVLQRIAA
jgi:hypothetical protein